MTINPNDYIPLNENQTRLLMLANSCRLSSIANTNRPPDYLFISKAFYTTFFRKCSIPKSNLICGELLGMHIVIRSNLRGIACYTRYLY